MAENNATPLNNITLFTIGFTQKSASQFFETLHQAGVKKIVDVRLNNVSQLAGFTKRDDLPYFLRIIGKIKYEHRPELAPTQELLDDYKKKHLTWPEYEERFARLMKERQVERSVVLEDMDSACLLCSEPKADKCHRRLVAEYLRAKWGNIDICHL